MTRKPWVDETLDALYYFDDDDHEELWALDDEPSP
jgi:hypothetical protein